MSDVRGIGIDLCDIPRMEKLVDNAAFLARSYTAQEQAYIRSRGLMASASMAAMWAAKEAALKALGVGIAIPMTDVEIVHEDTGRPVYRLHGRAAELALGGAMLLSITHEGAMAAAVCVWSV